MHYDPINPGRGIAKRLTKTKWINATMASVHINDFPGPTLIITIEKTPKMAVAI